MTGCASSGTTGDAASGARTVAILTPEDPGYWDEIICQREPLTGTRLTKSRCHSRYDRERMRGAATETMRDILSQPQPCGDGAGCTDQAASARIRVQRSHPLSLT